MIPSRSGLVRFLSLFIIGAVWAEGADAGIVNGGFETGDFAGWSTIGDAGIQTSSFGSGPTEGTFQALLTTISSATDGDPPFSGSDAVAGDALGGFLGLSAGSLDVLGGGPVVEGSALMQTFSANAGDVVSFDWNFLTSQSPSTDFNDLAFFTLNAAATKLADTSSPTVGSGTTFIGETGFGTFSFSIATTGTYTLGFGVFDLGDQFVNSALLVDNVRITQGQVVPEPGSLTLTGAAALVLLGRRWCRGRRGTITR